jgi:hypothetical protein
MRRSPDLSGLSIFKTEFSTNLLPHLDRGCRIIFKIVDYYVANKVYEEFDEHRCKREEAGL